VSLRSITAAIPCSIASSVVAQDAVRVTPSPRAKTHRKPLPGAAQKSPGAPSGSRWASGQFIPNAGWRRILLVLAGKPSGSVRRTEKFAVWRAWIRLTAASDRGSARGVASARVPGAAAGCSDAGPASSGDSPQITPAQTTAVSDRPAARRRRPARGEVSGTRTGAPECGSECRSCCSGRCPAGSGSGRSTSRSRPVDARTPSTRQDARTCPARSRTPSARGRSRVTRREAGSSWKRSDLPAVREALRSSTCSRTCCQVAL
jgi:hypothetical protein